MARKTYEGRLVKTVGLGFDKIFESCQEAARWVNKFDYDGVKKNTTLAGNIWRCASGIKPTAYGYHWEFAGRRCE